MRDRDLLTEIFVTSAVRSSTLLKSLPEITQVMIINRRIDGMIDIRIISRKAAITINQLITQSIVVRPDKATVKITYTNK